jgi:hypothetical protein
MSARPVSGSLRFARARGDSASTSSRVGHTRALQDVAPMRRAVGLADHHMGMNLGIALFQRDVAGERQYLDLLAHRDPSVLPALAVEVTEHHLAERADGREIRGTHSLAPEKLVSVAISSSPLSNTSAQVLSPFSWSIAALMDSLLTARSRTEGESGGRLPLSEQPRPRRLLDHPFSGDTSKPCAAGSGTMRCRHGDECGDAADSDACNIYTLG